MEGTRGSGGSENALSMASCNLIELFSFGPSGVGPSLVVSTTGDTGGSSLTALGEEGGHATKVGSGEMELPGVGSCEHPSVIWSGGLAMGAVPGCDLRVDWRALNLHHKSTCLGSASRPFAQRSHGGSVLSSSAT